jgi:hypothetical protein
VILAPLAVALALAAPPAPPGVSPEVHALVTSCVAAYGGPRAVARMARIRQEGTVTSEVLHPGTPGRIARAYQRAARLRVEIAYPDAPAEVRVLDGDKGWRFGQPVEGPFLTSMLLQAARMDLPGLLAAREERIQDRGTAAVGGKQVRILALPLSPGLVIEAHLEPDTGRIVRSRGAAEGAGPQMSFETTYSEFRQVDGVLVAFREENWANGRTTGETRLEKVSFPRDLPPETFRP